MAFDLRRLLGLAVPLSIGHAGTTIPTQTKQGNASQGLNVAGQGLSLESMPGLTVQPQQSGLNVAGQGLSLESMPGLQIGQPQHLRNLLHVSGGSPQGYPSDFAAAGFPQPNFQQAQPVQMQGVENPGLVPMQGSRGVRNPQSQAPQRHSPQITF